MVLLTIPKIKLIPTINYGLRHLMSVTKCTGKSKEILAVVLRVIRVTG